MTTNALHDALRAAGLTTDHMLPHSGAVARGILRRWCSAAGDAASNVRPMEALNVCWKKNDPLAVANWHPKATTAEESDRLLGITSNLTSVTPAPAPATTAMGGIEGAITMLVQQAMAGAAPGIDEDEVTEIVNRVVQPLSDKLSDIDSLINGGTSAKALNRQLSRAKVTSTNPLLAAIATNYPLEGPCIPTAISAPPSIGKSRMARMLGESYDLFIEHNCSNSPDEVARLVGEVRPGTDGKFRAVDGPLVRAMRAASKGQRVLFFMDELWRLGTDPQEFLLPFLQPHGGIYTIDTVHTDPATGAFEVLTAPEENLHILAAGNLNGSIPVEPLWSRFDCLTIEFSKDLIKEVAESVLDEHGVPTAKLPEAFAMVVAASRDMYAEGKITYPVDIRMLVRAAKQATATTEAAVAEQLKARLVNNIASWCPDLGTTISLSKKEAQVLANAFNPANF